METVWIDLKSVGVLTFLARQGVFGSKRSDLGQAAYKELRQLDNDLGILLARWREESNYDHGDVTLRHIRELSEILKPSKKGI